MKPETESAILHEIAKAKAAGGQIHEPTEFGDGSVPSDVYFGEERFREEVERVFWRSWIPVAREAELTPESFVARSVVGASVVLTKDAAEVVRGFYNTCRHRGSVVASGSGCAKKLVCPYHAWTYELNGSLAALPDPGACAPSFDRAEIGLRPVAVESLWGWIWVNLTESPPSLGEFLGKDLIDELANWPFAASESKGSRDCEAEFNWKVGVEGFLEPYHVPMVHKRSVNPVIVYKHGTMAWWGNHSRMVMMLRDPDLYEPDGILGEAAAGAGVGIFPKLNALQRASNFAYLVWPATILNLLPNHIIAITVEPIGPTRSRLKLDLFGRAGEGEASKDFWDAVLDAYGPVLEEDATAFAAVQRGLSGPFRPPLIFSYYDRRIRHFRQTLGTWMG